VVDKRGSHLQRSITLVNTLERENSDSCIYIIRDCRWEWGDTVLVVLFINFNFKCHRYRWIDCSYWFFSLYIR